MKKILIIGEANSIHLKQYINTILDRKKYNTTILNINNNKYISIEDLNFYYQQEITIINTKKVVLKGRRTRALLNLFNYYKSLKKLGTFDYCLIHMLSYQSVLLTLLLRNKIDKIIPVTYGSDVLRGNKVLSKPYNKLFNISTYIIFPNLNTKNVFNSKTKGEFIAKLMIIDFPNDMLQFIDNVQIKEINSLMESLSINPDKKVVICGHTATKAEQYEQMIEQISKLPPPILNRCTFLFLMTYGHGDVEGYRKTVLNLLLGSGIDFRILEEYLSEIKIAALHKISDIHITTIKTDAFSKFLAEQLYVGSLVIYGEWLNYHEIDEMGLVAFPIMKMEELSENIIDVLENFDKYKGESKINAAIIKRKSDNENIINQWEKILNGN